MTKSTLAIVLAALAATAPAAPVPDDAKAPVLFFPTTPVTWVYESWGVRWDYSVEVIEVVMSVQDRKGEKVLALGSVHDGKAHPSNSMMAVGGRGLTKGYTIFNERYETGDRVLRWPIVAGDSWAGRPRPEYLEWRYTTRGWETVTVPAGRYDAVRVDTSRVLHNGKTELVTSAWYAPGVGMVRWEDSEGRRQVLKRFVRGMAWEAQPPPMTEPPRVGEGR
jgi:hypothetical protein